MFKKLRNNPILAYQMSHADWPSLRTAVLITAALTVIGLASPVTSLLFYSVIPLTGIAGPLISTVTAVVATTEIIDLEIKEEINLSQLSDRERVKGYVACVLFQLRALWMVAGGLTLPFAVEYAAFQQAYFTTRYVELALFITLLLMIVFIAWNWLAINLGVWMACWYHDRGLGWGALLIFIPVILVIASPIAGIGSSNQLLHIYLASVVFSIASGGLAYHLAVKRARSMRG